VAGGYLASKWVTRGQKERFEGVFDAYLIVTVLGLVPEKQTRQSLLRLQRGQTQARQREPTGPVGHELFEPSSHRCTIDRRLMRQRGSCGGSRSWHCSRWQANLLSFQAALAGTNRYGMQWCWTVVCLNRVVHNIMCACMTWWSLGGRGCNCLPDWA
jgi:hypothetical protein